VKRKPSGYMIGDTWKSIGCDGTTATVWLSKIMDTFEVWMYNWCYFDKSGSNVDWTTSRALAVREVSYKCKDENGKIIRMKKVIGKQ
jgi:hypothetical protein